MKRPDMFSWKITATSQTYSLPSSIISFGSTMIERRNSLPSSLLPSSCCSFSSIIRSPNQSQKCLNFYGCVFSLTSSPLLLPLITVLYSSYVDKGTSTSFSVTTVAVAHKYVKASPSFGLRGVRSFPIHYGFFSSSLILFSTLNSC